MNNIYHLFQIRKIHIHMYVGNGCQQSIVISWNFSNEIFWKLKFFVDHSAHGGLPLTLRYKVESFK